MVALCHQVMLKSGLVCFYLFLAFLVSRCIFIAKGLSYLRTMSLSISLNTK
jgi:hypothetical protein